MSAENVVPIRVREPGEMGQLVGKPGETLTETLRRTLLEMIVFGYFERGFRLYPERLNEADRRGQETSEFGRVTAVPRRCRGDLDVSGNRSVSYHRRES